jgi:Protein of unknown function (DUF3126)
VIGACPLSSGLLAGVQTPINADDRGIHDMAMRDDVPKLQAYLRKRFNPQMRVIMTPKKTDMAEVFIGDDMIATLTLDDEDGEVCYQLQMAILDIDLDGV